MTSRKHYGRIIDTSIRIKSTPQRVWEAWAKPQQIANWFVDRAEGEATPGGTMKWFFDTFGYVMDVPILEAEPGRTFVTGADHDVSGGEIGPGANGLPYLMEITISKDGAETVLHLVNSGFSTDPKKDETYNGTVSGWAHALTTMKVWLEHYPLRSRHHDLVVRPATHTPAQLRALYATTEGRSRWMSPDVPHTGEVLCDTGSELMLSLPNQDGVIALKSFEMGPGRMVGLDLSVWPEAGATAEDAKARLNRALDRLVTLLETR